MTRAMTRTKQLCDTLDAIYGVTIEGYCIQSEITIDESIYSIMIAERSVQRAFDIHYMFDFFSRYILF